MSPIRVTPVIGEVRGVAPSPFVGPVNHTVGVEITPSDFTNDEIDEFGYLKPGIPLTRDGELITLTPGDGDDPDVLGVLYGVTVEHVKILENNATATIAAGTAPVEVAVANIAALNRDAAEDILGRAYTAAELAAFDAAGSTVKLYY